MTRFNHEQTNFNTGEVSPKFYGRTDLDKYINALRKCSNMIPLPQGPVTRRPGFKYVYPARQNGHTIRLIRFEFNVTQSYTLEFGPSYIRFFTNEGIVLNTPGASVATGSPLGLLLSITRASNDYDPATLPYEVNSPYTEAELYQIGYAQSGDIVFLFHNNHPIQELRRTGAATFTLTELDYQDGPYDPVDTTASTMTASATTGTINMTSSTAIFTTTAQMKGMLIRTLVAGKWGAAKIVSITSTTVAVCTVQSLYPLGGTGASTSWRYGSWSPVKGYPGVGCFYQQRLILGNTLQDPDTIFGSTSSDFRTFSPTDNAGAVQDNLGFNYPIGSDTVNSIVWMCPGKVVVVGTKGGEWILVSGSQANPDPLTPTSVKITLETTYGSEQIPALRIESAVLFVDKSARKIREFLYNYNIDAFSALELNILCDHFFRGAKITNIAWAEHPNATMWIALDNGDLLSMVYLRSQQVVGFAKHPVGGRYFETGEPVGLLLAITRGEDSKPEIQSLVTVHSPDGTHSQLWACVRRYINGSLHDSIEFMTPDFAPSKESDKVDAFFVDSALTSTNTVPVSTITGLDYLENEVVSVLGDGAAQSDKTVVNGSITLDSPSYIVTVGLQQPAYIETLDPKEGGNAGTAQAKTKRVHKLALRLVDTIGVQTAELNSSSFPIYFREPTDVQNQGPRLFSGIKKTEVDAAYAEEQTLLIQQTQPLPLTVTAIYADGSVNEV